MSAGPLCPQIQPFLTINTVGFLMVNQPAFPAQQDMYALHAVADAGFRYFPYPLRDCAVVTPALIVVDRAALHHQTATTPQPDTVGLQQPGYRLPLLGRSQNFF